MREVERFKVIGESGQSYTAVIYEEQIDASHMGGRAAIGGMRVAQLDDGRTLTHAGENQWRIVQTWELVRRAD